MSFRLHVRTNTISSFHANITLDMDQVNMLSTLISMSHFIIEHFYWKFTPTVSSMCSIACLHSCCRTWWKSDIVIIVDNIAIGIWLCCLRCWQICNISAGCSDFHFVCFTQHLSGFFLAQNEGTILMMCTHMHVYRAFNWLKMTLSDWGWKMVLDFMTQTGPAIHRHPQHFFIKKITEQYLTLAK